MNNRWCWVTLGLISTERLIRRLGTRWGANDDEVHACLAGDDIIPHPMLETTHAVTLETDPATVWPWLVQMGFHRGGWYSDVWWGTLLEDLVFVWSDSPESRHNRPKPSATRVLPQFQQLAVGDIVPDGPEGSAYFTVRVIEPERALVYHSTTHLKHLTPHRWQDHPQATSGEFSWAFVLRPLPDQRTRLLLRTRATIRPSWTRSAEPIFFLADFAIVRRMFRNLKERVEDG